MMLGNGQSTAPFRNTCAQSVPRRLARLLKEEGYKRVSSIPNAAVPLGEPFPRVSRKRSLTCVPTVKFTDPETGMSCDVNINNRLGVYNTALLRQYCLRSPSLARYLRTVKLWVKSVDLNNPAAERGPRSFSSYAITLMTVAWLQVRSRTRRLHMCMPLIPHRAPGVCRICKKTET